MQMESRLRKYSYNGRHTTRPATSSKTASTPVQTTTETNATMNVEAIKADILTSLRAEISTVIREEFKRALADNFEALATELRAVKAEIASNTATMRTEIAHVKSIVKDMEVGLSTWSDEVVSLQSSVAGLKGQVDELNGKCEDMEGRMRRGNIRIMGVAETTGSATPDAVSKLLKEVFRMEKDPQIERSHRGLAQRKPGDKPRVIIAKLHEGDAIDILQRARVRGGQLSYNGNAIAIFPDYTAKVDRARAAFTDVRKMLCGREGVRYGLRYPARFLITHNNEEKEFVDAAKAMDYMKKNFV